MKDTRPKTRLVTYSAAKLSKVEAWRADDLDPAGIHGFQRPRRQSAIDNIAVEAHAGTAFPAVMFAVVGQRTLEIDGGHRKDGHIKAGLSLSVLEVYCDIEEARRLFILHNVLSRKLARRDQARAGTTASCAEFRWLESTFGLSGPQALGFQDGLNGGTKVNYRNGAGSSTAAVRRRAHAVLTTWTGDASFSPSGKPTKLSKALGHGKTMQIMGRLAAAVEDFPGTRLTRAVRILLRDKHKLFSGSRKRFCTRKLREKPVGEYMREVENYVLKAM